MSSIQPHYIHFSDISKVDGMPASGLTWKSLEIQNVSRQGRRSAQFHDESLKIETQDAHDRLVTVLNSSTHNRLYLFSFKSLTIMNEVQNIDIDTLFRSCPFINQLILPSNQTIPLFKLLNHPSLTILHIREPKIHWNPTEKHTLLSQSYRKKLEIFIQNNPYQFDYPSRFFFRISFIMLNIFLLFGVTGLMSMSLDHHRQENRWILSHFFTKKAILPLTIISASLILQIQLYLYALQKRKDQSFEIIRPPKDST